MKALKTISTIALAALVFASCQEKELEVSPVLTPDSLIKVGEQITINATHDADQTKTVLQSDKSIYWSPADQISVLYGDSKGFSKGTFTSQNTAPAATAEFSGTLNTVLGSTEGTSSTPKYLYGVFPASDDAAITVSDYDDELLVVPFKYQQTAVEGSFDPEAVTSVARSSSLDLSFYNVVSVLALTVQEDDVLGIDVENIDKSIIGIGCQSMRILFQGDGTPYIWGRNNQTHYVSLDPPAGQDTFTKGKTYYMAVLPGTYNAGVKFTLYKMAGNIELTIDTPVTAERSKIHAVTLQKPAPKPALERVFGWYSTSEALWTPNVTAISITHPDAYGMARGLTMDDEYIYLPKSSAYPALAGVKISDPTDQVSCSVSGVDAGDTFKTSFVRMIKNTDSSVNGGKDVLLMSNLSAANGGNIVIYAYPNGITAAPIKLAQFAWDSANEVEDWRRYGDRFFVTGTWQDGKIYLPSFNEGKIVVLSVANGARTAVAQYTATTNSPAGIKDLTVYPGDTKLFLTNNSIANLVAADGSKTNGWDTYVLSASSSNGVGTWGYNFFEFNGKNYIAYARISGNKAWIEVIEDKGDLISSLAAQDGLLKAPIHSATSLDAEHATGGVADCCVRIINNVPYIAALTRDGGLVVDKLVLK